MPIPDRPTVLMITSELHPIVKVGGLADAVSQLSQYLQAQGCDVRVVMPMYRDCACTIASSFPVGAVTLGKHRYNARVNVTSVGNIPVYLLDIPELYDRDGIYGPRVDAAFDDNLVRYGIFCAAVPHICAALQWQPDIIHGHDWEASLVPCLHRLHHSAETHRPAHIITIHNIGYQGEFATEDIEGLGLTSSQAKSVGLIHNNRLNLLAGGIYSSDRFSTVSRTYSKEIQHHHGFGLERLVRQRTDKLAGITNGLDYDEWDPLHDPYISCCFDSDRIEGKLGCKKQLQQHFNLPVDENIPVIGLVSRLVEQKGIVELADPTHGALQQLVLSSSVQYVILGSGEQWCEKELVRLGSLHCNVGVHIGFDTTLSHMIAAGSDFFLMPSRYEPCGLSQLYAMRYGSLPIATRTGGIADTVTDKSTGFLFESATPQNILRSVQRAVATYNNHRSEYERMQQNAMQQRHNWEKAAGLYIEMYRTTLLATEHHSAPRRRFNR